MNPTKMLVVIGSTRPVRIGDQVALIVAEAASGIPSVDVVLEDLAIRALPLLDEPQPPAMGAYVHQHSKDWAATVTEADAVVFVTPEYNAGYPAALKNAIDYLYSEWNNKPVLLVSYGSRGGYRAQKQLREVASSLKMRPVETPVLLTLGRGDFDSSGRLSDPAGIGSLHADQLRTALLDLVASTARHEASLTTVSAAA